MMTERLGPLCGRGHVTAFFYPPLVLCFCEAQEVAFFRARPEKRPVVLRPASKGASRAGQAQRFVVLHPEGSSIPAAKPDLSRASALTPANKEVFQAGQAQRFVVLRPASEEAPEPGLSRATALAPASSSIPATKPNLYGPQADSSEMSGWSSGGMGDPPRARRPPF
jgi:hypothetical protein